MGRVNLPHVDVITQKVTAEFKGRCYDAEFVSHCRWLATTRLRGTLFGAYGDSFEAAIETCHKAIEMYDDSDPPPGYTPGLGMIQS